MLCVVFLFKRNRSVVLCLLSSLRSLSQPKCKRTWFGCGPNFQIFNWRGSHPQLSVNRHSIEKIHRGGAFHKPSTGEVKKNRQRDTGSSHSSKVSLPVFRAGPGPDYVRIHNTFVHYSRLKYVIHSFSVN